MENGTTILVLLLVLVGLVLARLVDRGKRRRPNDDLPGVRLPLSSNNSYTQAFARIGVATGTVSLVVALGFLIAGQRETALGIAFLAVLEAFLFWSVRLRVAGELELRADALLIHQRSVMHEYPWHDIESMRTSSWRESGRSERALIRATGVSLDGRFVCVRLRRPASVMFGFWTTRIGSSTGGLPIFIKEIKIFTQNADTLLELARPYLEEARAAQQSSHRAGAAIS